jgi:hypothetical protein
MAPAATTARERQLIASPSLSSAEHRKWALTRDGASLRAPRVGFPGRFDAGAAVRQAVPRATAVVGAGHGLKSVRQFKRGAVTYRHQVTQSRKACRV